MNYELFFPLHFPAFASIIILMSSRYTAYPQYQPPLTKMHPLVPRHLLPINLLKICGHLRCRIVKTIHPCIVLTVSFGSSRNITSDINQRHPCRFCNKCSTYQSGQGCPWFHTTASVYYGIKVTRRSFQVRADDLSTAAVQAPFFRFGEYALWLN